MSNISIDTYFDKIIVIKLLKSKDRLEKIINCFKMNNIVNYEIFRAIDVIEAEKSGWKIPTAHSNRPGVTYDLMKRQLACKLSHYGVLKLMKERGYNRILILEDDAFISKENLLRLNSSLKDIEDNDLNWDMLYLFASFPNIGGNIVNDVYRLNYSPGAVAYGVSINKLDDIIRSVEMNEHLPIDDIYCAVVHHYSNTICIHPWVVETGKFKSVINFG